MAAEVKKKKNSKRLKAKENLIPSLFIPTISQTQKSINQGFSNFKEEKKKFLFEK